MHSLLGGVRNLQGRWPEAILACRQAVGEADSVGELAALAHAYYALDIALVQSGRSKEATNSWAALKIFEQLGDAEHESMVLNNLGVLAYFEGRWDDAISLYLRAGEASERAGLPATVAYTDGNVGEILSDQGRLDEAETHLQRARRIWIATGDQNVGFLDVLLARLTIRRGHHREGIAMLEAAVASLRRLKLDADAGFAQALIAEAEALGGDPLVALDIASRELQAQDRLRPLLTRVAGVALARLGEREAAIRELRHSMQTARERGADYDVAATIDVLSVLGEAEESLRRERDELFRRMKIVHHSLPTLS
jgi:tetratricopeptide (TPR) repeat protein